MTHDREVDARDLICPLPVLRARKVLLGMTPGEVLRVLATDPMAAWELRRQARVRADIIVCSASDFESDRTVPNTLAFEASHFGVLLP